jgi:hypothetical protein
MRATPIALLTAALASSASFAVGLTGCAGCEPEGTVPIIDPGALGDPRTIHVADNGLGPEEARQFYSLSEGSGLFPLAWFLTIDSNVTKRPFREGLDRFGFLFSSPPKDRWNLPIGLTVNHAPEWDLDMVGVNCAACHVGEIHYGAGARLRIDGAPNLFDIEAFYNELVSSMQAALTDPDMLTRLLFGREDDTAQADTDAVLRAMSPAIRSPRRSRRPADETELRTAIEGVHRTFTHTAALRAEGAGGAVLADHLEQTIQEEIERFDQDYAELGAPLVTAILLGRPEPTEPTDAPKPDGPGQTTTPSSSPSPSPSPTRSQSPSPSPSPLPAPSPAAGPVDLARLTDVARRRSPGELTALAVRRPDVTQDWLSQLRRRLRLLLARIEFLRAVVGKQTDDTTPHFGRVDAFGFARNFLFGREFGFTANTAPVSYPHLWGFERTKWLHWNGNTTAVLTRNIGQALGVGAVADRTSGDTSVLVDQLHRLERLAYRIAPPRWPRFMPQPIAARAARGATVYRERCAWCHDVARTDDSGLLDYPMIHLALLGTDPRHARDFARPLRPVGPKNPSAVEFDRELQAVLGVIEAAYFKSAGTAPPVQAQWQGNRKEVRWRAMNAYRASPLAGTWATAPYLHNNSVPTLYHLLLPPRCRPARFQIGDRRFDPRHVGYVWSLDAAQAAAAPADCPTVTPLPAPPAAATVRTAIVDTTLPGNGNGGHLYGTDLSEDDRWALVEYLKGPAAAPPSAALGQTR